MTNEKGEEISIVGGPCASGTKTVRIVDVSNPKKSITYTYELDPLVDTTSSDRNSDNNWFGVEIPPDNNTWSRTDGQCDNSNPNKLCLLDNSENLRYDRTYRVQINQGQFVSLLNILQLAQKCGFWHGHYNRVTAD
ncbi:MAG: hypothetical protein LBP35_06210 [Candidatus Ancillula trichonymphae]|nr:hypothetical protein [Candidatus Ancillula trichonymphae]